MLGSAAKATIETADSILIPVIAFWETAILVRKGRLALKRSQPVAEGVEVEIRKRNIPIARVVPVTKRHQNRTRLGCGAATARILSDLTEPFIPEHNWDMLREQDSDSRS